MRSPLLFLTTASSLALASQIQAQLVVNPPEPITKAFLIQIVDTAANDGSTPAPLFGTPAQQAAIFSDVNTIWAQAGIQINFEFLPATWNNSFALLGTPGSNNPRPAQDLNTIVGDANSSHLSLDSNANQMFMLQIVPTFSQEDNNTAVGYSFTNANGMTIWAGTSLPTTTAGQDALASVMAHEIGRNLGLLTDPTDSENLMNPAFTTPAGQLLTSSQISTADSSPFLTSAPEPATGALLLTSGLVLTMRRRR